MPLVVALDAANDRTGDQSSRARGENTRQLGDEAMSWTRVAGVNPARARSGLIELELNGDTSARASTARREGGIVFEPPGVQIRCAALVYGSAEGDRFRNCT